MRDMLIPARALRATLGILDGTVRQRSSA